MSEHPMRLHVVLEAAEEGGFTAQCVEIPGAISEGDTTEEALSNVQDAIRSVLEVRRMEAEALVSRAVGASHRLETVDVDA